MDFYDYYKVLGVRSSASTFEIKKAFKSKAKLIHPDVNPSPKAKDAFQVLQRAYATLNNPITRNQYDLKLQLIHAARIIKKNAGSKKNRPYRRSTHSSTFHGSYQHLDDSEPGKFFTTLLYCFGMFFGAILISLSLSIFFFDGPTYVLAFFSLPGYILVRDGILGLRRQRVGDGKKK